MHFSGLHKLGLLGLSSFGVVKKATTIDLSPHGVSTIVHQSTGTCTPDGLFIWDQTTDGTPFLRRLKANEPCGGTSGANPTINHHNSDGSTTVTTPDGQTYTIPPMVSSDTSGRTIKAEHLKRSTMSAQLSALNGKALVASGVLPACDPSSYVAGLRGQGTYACFPYANDGQLPPMVFSAYGTDVAFSVGELIQDKGFIRAYQPNEDQTFWTAWYIYNTSKDSIGAALEDFAQQHVLSDTVMKAKIANPSVGDVLAWLPDARTKIDGFAWNPPQPSSSQLTNAGGMLSWLNNGGWFISFAVASGQSRLGSAWSMSVCVNTPCMCQTNFVETEGRIALKLDDTIGGVMATCQAGWVKKDGSIQTSGSSSPTDTATWETFVDIVSDPKVWHCSVRHQDPTWLIEVASVLGAILDAIAQAFCARGPSFGQQLNTLAAEKCIDKSNKVCKKGTIGCTCVTPSSSTTVGVGLTSWWISQWCKEFQKETNEFNNPASQQPVAPPASSSTTIVPTWAIFLGAVAAIGVAYKYSRPTKPGAPKPKPLLPSAP